MPETLVKGHISLCLYEKELFRQMISGQRVAEAKLTDGRAYHISNEVAVFGKHDGTLTLHPENELGTVLHRCVAHQKLGGLELPITSHLKYYRDLFSRIFLLTEGKKIRLSMHYVNNKRVFAHSGYYFSHSDYQSLLRFSCTQEDLYSCLVIGFINGEAD